MHRPIQSRILKGAALVVLAVLLAGGGKALWAALPTGRFLSIKPATTWVGIARVYLEIGDLQQAGELLEGTYQIRVPLAPDQNDTGRVRLRVPGLLDELGADETTVFGDALSSSGQVNDVIARISPNGVVRIDIVTPGRTLRFKSRYASR